MGRLRDLASEDDFLRRNRLEELMHEWPRWGERRVPFMIGQRRQKLRGARVIALRGEAQ